MYGVCPKCGLMYDDSKPCPKCGFGTMQSTNVQGTGVPSAPVAQPTQPAQPAQQAQPLYTVQQTTPVQPLYTVQSNNSNNKQESKEKFELNDTVKKIIIIVSIILVLAIGVAIAVPVWNHFSGNYSSVDDDYYYDEYEDYDEYNDDYFEENYNGLMYMPNLVGEHVDDIEDYLGSFYRNVRYEYEFSDEFDKDYIIRQNIDETEELTPYSEIVLTVSKGEDECPYDYQQKIVVTGSSSSSYATMELLVWEDGDWKSEYSCSATVGRNGIGTNYGEGKGITPEGIFKLGVVLSDRSISNGDWPCEIVDSDTCIIDDTSSQYYNTILDKDGIPSGTGYDNIGDTIVNGDTDKCMYIEHNGDGFSSENVVPGKGSAITICGKTSSIHATAGCVDITSSDFNALLSMLDYSKNPHIEIVG